MMTPASFKGVGFSSDDEEQNQDTECQVIVKGTFIDLTDAPSMKQRYLSMRKMKTDSALESRSDPEVYEPGKFSADAQARQQETCQEPPQIQVHLQESPQAQPQDQKPVPQRKRAGRTTLMMRNLPNNYTRDMFLAMLDNEGLACCYDFVYLPFDFGRNANLGYAFVNLVDAQTVDSFWKAFDGFSDWELPTAKVCQVTWSGPHQGFKAHVERYRNSPVMHRSVPDEYKPMIFAEGVRQPFPPPTKKIKPPHKAGGR